MNVYETLLKARGRDHQLRKAQEECAELIVAINKYLDNPTDFNLEQLIGEGADTDNMLHQIRTIFPSKRKLWKQIMDAKKKRALESLK